MNYMKIDKIKKVIGWSPKCGSTSIKTKILEEIKSAYNIEMIDITKHAHTHLKEFCQSEIAKEYNLKIETYVENIPEDYICELYVRDPYHRLASLRYRKKQTKL